MEIEKRIEKIKDYFEEMKIIIMKDDKNEDTHVVYVTINIPETWIIDETTEKRFGVSCIKSNNEWQNQYSFFAELSTGIDKVFDAVDYNIQNNIIAEKKISILRKKTEELKKMFQNENYNVDELERLDFNIGKKTTVQTSFGTKIAEKTENAPQNASKNKKEESKK